MKNAPIVPAPVVRFWLLALFWIAVLFGFSAVPGSAYPQVDIPHADKVVHVCLYTPLGYLFGKALLAIAANRVSRAGRWLARVPALQTAVAVLLTIAYGVTDEIHQIFVPRRSSDWHDVVADGIGGVIGAILARRLFRDGAAD